MLNLGPLMRTLALAAIVVIAVGVLSSGRSERASADDGICGPMDVVFLIDDTGSMGGSIAAVQAAVGSIISDINTASGGDFQLGLVTFKDNVVVLDDLASGNTASVQANILALAAGGGAGAAGGSEAAVTHGINGLGGADRLPGE